MLDRRMPADRLPGKQATEADGMDHWLSMLSIGECGGGNAGPQSAQAAAPSRGDDGQGCRTRKRDEYAGSKGPAENSRTIAIVSELIHSGLPSRKAYWTRTTSR